MSKKAVFWSVVGLALLLAVISIIMFIMAIWIPDERWVMTGMILLFCGIFVGLGAPLVKPSESANG